MVKKGRKPINVGLRLFFMEKNMFNKSVYRVYLIARRRLIVARYILSLVNRLAPGASRKKHNARAWAFFLVSRREYERALILLMVRDSAIAKKVL